MFCNKCGKQLADGVVFCDGCGAAVEQAPVAAQPAQPVQPASYAQPAQYAAPAQYAQPTQATQYATPVPPAPKKKTGLIVGLACGGAALVVAIVLLIVFLIPKGYSSPESVAEAAIKATCEIDAETLLDCVPDALWKSEFGNVDKKTVAKMLEAQADADDRMTCVILSSRRVYDADYSYSDILEEAEDYFDDDIAAIASIQDACVVEVSAIIDGDSETIEVACIKMDNSWYVLELDM